MIKQTFNDVYTEELAQGAIINNEFEGFERDYLILHCLIRKYKLATFFEIGTNFGTGTKIICNAIYGDRIKEGDRLIFPPVCSLDLPFERLHESMVHNGKDMVGSNCNLPFTQLRGDSVAFDYGKYPCEGYFIDGEHDLAHVRHESYNIISLNPKIIIYHDMHVLDVENAVADAFYRNRDYTVYRVENTRIAYALRDGL